MTDSEVVIQDDIESEDAQDRRDGRRWGLLVVLLILLLLLLTCVVTSAREWVTRGPQQAEFIARNIDCLQCHTELIPELKRKVVHNPFAMEECTTCHTPHGSKVSVSVVKGPSAVWRRYTTRLEWLPLKWWFSLESGRAGRVSAADAGVDQSQRKTVTAKGQDSELVMAEDDLCWLCHGDMGAKLSDPYQHQPFHSGRCTNCHDPHASDYSGLLSQAPNKICLTCHPIGSELARKQQHAPVASGWCIDCHDPHASKYKGVLKVSQRELCFGCHPSVAGLSEMPVQHTPFENGDCTGCHEPHGADYQPLLKAYEPKLCYNCHPRDVHEFGSSSKHLVGVDLNCSSCHDPHAAQYAGVINARDNSFCARCHGEVDTTYEQSKHRELLCIECHLPHGSDFAPILRGPVTDVCLQCHPSSGFDESSLSKVRNNHPVRPSHYDVNARAPLTCTSSCHAPHGTENNYMLRYYSSPADGNCLMCHAVKRGKIVGIDF